MIVLDFAADMDRSGNCDDRPVYPKQTSAPVCENMSVTNTGVMGISEACTPPPSSQPKSEPAAIEPEVVLHYNRCSVSTTIQEIKFAFLQILQPSEPIMSERKPAKQFDQSVLDLYDDYAHGRLDRRDYVKRLAAFAVGGLTVEGLINSLSPNYAWAEQVKADDPRIETETATFSSPQGGGEMKGLLAHPAKVTGKFPAVLVIHENRGLNPYIEDVARRLAVDGFLAFAPDALTPLGGYPGNDDEGRSMQARRNGDEMTQDFIAAAKWLDTHELSTGKVGAVGFCYGGGMVNQLVVMIPDVIDAGVPFYGRQPELSNVPKIKAPLLIHNAGLDNRILAGASAFETALKENGKSFEAFVYDDVNHGFHNDTTPRYDEPAAELAWARTIAFFKQTLNK